MVTRGTRRGISEYVNHQNRIMDIWCSWSYIRLSLIILYVTTIFISFPFSSLQLFLCHPSTPSQMHDIFLMLCIYPLGLNNLSEVHLQRTLIPLSQQPLISPSSMTFPSSILAHQLVMSFFTMSRFQDTVICRGNLNHTLLGLVTGNVSHAHLGQ